MKVLATAVGVALFAIVGCRFDDSALRDRGPCTTDDDCAPGLCLAGNCVDATLVDGGSDFDGGVVDTGGASDVGSGMDTVDDGSACSEGFAECVGTVARRCEGGAFVEQNCADDGACDGDACACSDGFCVPSICTPGQRRCAPDGGEPEICDESGAAWVRDEACDEGEACVAGRCVVAECEPESRGCVGDTIVVCGPTGQWDEVQDCAVSDAWCDIGDEGPVCRPRVCTPGAARCVDEGRSETCNASGSAWSLDAPCDDGEVCLDGACVPDVCEPGETTCLDEGTLGVCGDDGVFGSESCGAARCIEGPAGAACEAGACPVGASRCIGTRTGFETCDGAGWVGPSLCPVNQFCDDGACVDDICAVGARTCEGDDIAECDGVGGGYTIVPCGEGTSCLVEGATASCRRLVCSPGAIRCTSVTSRQQCNDLGTAWRAIDGCSGGSVCVDGTCETTVCEPGESECVDATTVRRCSDDGTVETTEACVGGQVCRFGACVDDVCEPGARFCDGLDARRCAVSGDGSTVLETCEFGCSDGFCDEPRCGDGIVTEAIGEVCDDGNDDPCDGCDGCQVRGYGSLSAAASTSDAASWVPGDDDVTLELWVRGSGSGALVGIGDSAANETIYVGLDRGRPFVQATFLAGRALRAEATASIDDGGWHHVAAQRISRDGLALWVDGRLRATAYLDLPSTSIDAGAFWIGSDGTLTSAVADIDEVRISSRAVYADRFTPTPRIPGGARDVRAHYRFDQSEGALVSEGDVGRDMSVTALTLQPGTCFADESAVACGDGVRAPWERCDDGDTTSGDGCSSTCVTEIECGTGTSGPDGQCFVTVATNTFSGANTACTRLGGTLVTVDHAVENLFLQRLYPGTTPWIGLGDYRAEDTWAWVDGGTASYRNWASGEPNGGRAENCVSITTATGLWSDQNCNSPRRGGVCEL